MTSVFIAAKNNCTHVLSYLLQVPGVDINARDKVIYTYIIVVVEGGFLSPPAPLLAGSQGKLKNAFVGVNHDCTCDYSGCC